MAQTSTSANLRFIINNNDVLAPEGWRDIGVVAAFSDENLQATINTDELVFSNTARAAILDWIERGVSDGAGVFEGIPFDIQAFNNSESLYIFSGHIALYDGYVDQPQVDRIRVKVVQNESQDSLKNRTQALTFSQLQSEGFITASEFEDVGYDIVPLDQTEELLIVGITGYLLTKELIENTEKLADDIATISGISSSSATGTAGGLVYSIAIAVVRAAYAAAILIVLFDLATLLLDSLLPIIRNHKCISFENLAEGIAEKLGYNFNTSVDNFDQFKYLPSNPNNDSLDGAGLIEVPGTIKNALPRPSDYGYFVFEMMELMQDMFRAKFTVVDGVLEFHPLVSDFWEKQSLYKLPDTRSDADNESLNTDEKYANIYLTFSTDLSDEYTITNFTGTNYEVITTPKTVQKAGNESNKGLLDYKFNVALGTRKDNLSIIEKAILPVANLLDTAINVFGGSSNFASKVKSRSGVMKVSSNNHTVPKVLLVNNGRIPPSDREILSAKALYENYHTYDSFVANNFKKQRRVFTNREVPFGLSDYNTLIKNSYFTTSDNKRGKVTDINWKIGADKATISYWIQEVYTTNLQEQKIEG